MCLIDHSSFSAMHMLLLIFGVNHWVIAVALPRISLIFLTSSHLALLNAYPGANYEYVLDSYPVSHFMATTPDDLSVYVYSSDRLTVVDQYLRIRHNASCRLNGSNRAVSTPLYCMYEVNVASCSTLNSHPELFQLKRCSLMKSAILTDSISSNLWK